MNIYPLIMCGGPGARLWPSSTATRPKPFLDLLGSESLFQKTVLRLAKIPGAQPPVVITGTAHGDVVKRQLAAISQPGIVLAEPDGRDSGPALVAAVAWIAARHPDAVVVAVASDHYIPDDAAFAAAVAAAARAAGQGAIVTFGVAPSEASVAYGYIRPGAPLSAGSAVRRVDAFVEKPDAARARDLIAAGCLWNSGNFMFRADALLAEAELYAPTMFATVAEAVAAGSDRDGLLHLGAIFREAEKISIDFAIMEKTRHAAVLPIGYAWSDLGSWDAVWAASEKDASGNAVTGFAALQSSEGCFIRAEPGTEVVVLGLKNIAVVAREGQVLVSDLSRASGLKPALEVLARARPAPPVQDEARDLALAAERLQNWLWRDALPLWWSFGADHDNGGFHEALNHDLTPTGADRRTRVQARQTFVYAAAGLHGWPGPWRAAMNHGLAYLFERYERPDGLYRAVVSPTGAAVDDSAALYDQAFVLLALATAARADPHQAAMLDQRARRLMDAVRIAFAHDNGGYRAHEGAQAFLLDPIMHLFESALAWRRVDNSPYWSDLADELGTLFLDRLFDHAAGSVREDFDRDWRPAPGLVGRMIRPGHHFEWAWLLRQWSSQAGAQAAAAALMIAGERGVDPTTDLVLDVLLDDFAVHAGSSRLWPQAERVRAALSFSRNPSANSAHLRAAARSASALERYFDTPVAGLWRDTPGADPAGDDPSPASSLYHILGAVTALGEGRDER